MAQSQADRLARLEARHEHIEADVAAIKADVRQIRDALLQGKGGWKTAASLLGVVAAILISTMTAWAVNLFGPTKGPPQ